MSFQYLPSNDQFLAAENLVGYSTAQPSLFKYNQLEPIKDLKLLVKDYPPIAKHALTILVNISDDAEVLEKLTTDDPFLDSLFKRVTVRQFTFSGNSMWKPGLIMYRTRMNPTPTKYVCSSPTWPKQTTSPSS